jgi:hypothetical protein
VGLNIIYIAVGQFRARTRIDEILSAACYNTYYLGTLVLLHIRTIRVPHSYMAADHGLSSYS